MSKFTPGPWVAEKNKSYWFVAPETGAGDGKPFQVADVCSSEPGHRDGWLQEANARLIAAAPELLEFVTEWLERQGDDNNYMTSKARAAIAKATGGNQ